MWYLPFVVGHAKIYIGDNVNFFGKIDIFSGRLFEEPKLVLGNRVDLGHNVVFLVNKEIVLEDDINVASGVRFMDTDAHPRDAMERIADLPPRPEEVKPVRVGRYAWIGHNSFIMKGVTIGEGAIIGVNSVVVNDIPPYCVAMGNPARVVVKNINQTAARHRQRESCTSGALEGQSLSAQRRIRVLTLIENATVTGPARNVIDYGKMMVQAEAIYRRSKSRSLPTSAGRSPARLPWPLMRRVLRCRRSLSAVAGIQRSSRNSSGHYCHQSRHPRDAQR